MEYIINMIVIIVFCILFVYTVTSIVIVHRGNLSDTQKAIFYPAFKIMGNRNVKDTSGSDTSSSQSPQSPQSSSTGSGVVTKSSINKKACLLKNAKFYQSNYRLNRDVNFDTISNINKDKLDSLCSSGEDVYKSGCNNYFMNPKKIYPYNTYCCTDGVCDDRSKKCTIDKSTLSRQSETLSDLSFNTPDARDSLYSFCGLGMDLDSRIRSGTCNESTYTPKGDDNFLNLCCNGSYDKCSIDSVKCRVNRDKFNTLDVSNYSIESMSEDSVLKSVEDYCKTGISLLECGDTVDNTTFRKLCCGGGSSIDSDCNLESLYCVQSVSKYKGFLSTFSSLSNKDSDTQVIDRLCSLGKSLISNGCTLHHDPMDDKDFRDYCCDGSYDPLKCEDKLPVCVNKTIEFKNLATNLSSLSINSYNDNIDSINKLCVSGESIKNDSCFLNPIVDETYRKYCCNSSIDSNNCNEKSRTCIYDISTMKNIDSANSENYKEFIIPDNTESYCKLGIDMLNNECNDNPMNIESFRKVCCNNDINPYSCSIDSLNCYKDSSEMKKLEYSIDYSGDYNNMYGKKDSINEYCSLGYSMIERGCRSEFLQSKTFTDLCCSGRDEVNDGIGKCNNDSLSCLNSTIDYKNNISIPFLQGETPYINDENYTVARDLCLLGEKVEKCGLVDPVNDSQYRKICCNNKTTGCGLDALDCLRDSSDFIENEREVNISFIDMDSSKLDRFCLLGGKNTNCGRTESLSSEKYRKFCCENDVNCDSNKSGECRNKIKMFNSLSNYGLDTTMLTNSVNIDNATKLCSVGYDIESSKCILFDEIKKDSYKNLCCKDGDCNQDVLRCNIESAKFKKDDVYSSVIDTIDYEYLDSFITSNESSIKSYCSTAFNSGCDGKMFNTGFFNKYCCLNGECSEDANNCNINREKIHGHIKTIDSIGIGDINNLNSSNLFALNNSTSIKSYCSLLKDVESCNYDKTHIEKYKDVCGYLDCLPKLSELKTRIGEVSKNSIDNQILNAYSVCSIASDTMAKCPGLKTEIESEPFVQKYCPIKEECGRYIGTTHYTGKYSYSRDQSQANADYVCDTGNTAIKICGDGTMSSKNFYTDYISTEAIYSQNCKPVNCQVGQWDNTGVCDCGDSSTVGTRKIKRSITVNPKNYGSIECPVLESTIECNQCTPIDCTVSEWTAWSKCSGQVCGENGVQTRTRSIITPAYNGGKCPVLIETRDCIGPCDCKVSDWTEWSKCPIDSCYNGAPISNRTRSIIQNSSNGGKPCPSLNENHPCNTNCKFRVYPNSKPLNFNNRYGESYGKSIPECATECEKNTKCVQSSAYMYNQGSGKYNYCFLFDADTGSFQSSDINTIKKSRSFPTSNIDITKIIGKWKDVNGIVYSIYIDNNIYYCEYNNTFIGISVDVINNVVVIGGSKYGVLSTLDNIYFYNEEIWSRVY